MKIMKFSGGRRAAILTLLLAALLLLPQTASAAGVAYETDSFDVQVQILENNAYMVTETINVNFITEAHGIYRYIPAAGKITLDKDGARYGADGSVKIKDLTVSGAPLNSKEYTNGYLLLQLGDPNETVLGEKEYVISYTVVCHEDEIEDFDFVYYNVLPQSWETAISRATFSVTFPKEFEAGETFAYTGRYGSPISAEFNITGNTVSGEYIHLPAGSGVTLLSYLPEGYFTGESNNNWAIAALVIGLVLCAALAVLLWVLFGKDPKLVQTVEFYPPEGITPAEAGYIIDGKADKEDIVSMVIYFAQQGYITIEEEKYKMEGLGGFFGKEKEVFYLNKETEALPESEKGFAHTLFKGLFQKGDRVRIDELNEDFYDYYISSMTQLKAYYNENKERRVYTRSSTAARAVGYVLSGVPLALCMVLSAVAAYDSALIVTGMAVVTWCLSAIGYMRLTKTHDRKYNITKKSAAGLRIAGIVCLMIPYSLVLFTVGVHYDRMILSAAAIASSLIVYIFTKFMYKRTAESVRLLGMLLGFKEFIRLAELDRLKRLVDEDPSYFYSILPYAYVFGLSDKWAKKFEAIAVPAPDWYRGGGTTTAFNTWAFMGAFNSCTNALSNNIVIPASTGGGGGASFGGGGGFSGGGFGGGGGGAW